MGGMVPSNYLVSYKSNPFFPRHHLPPTPTSSTGFGRVDRKGGKEDGSSQVSVPSATCLTTEGAHGGDQTQPENGSGRTKSGTPSLHVTHWPMYSSPHFLHHLLTSSPPPSSPLLPPSPSSLTLPSLTSLPPLTFPSSHFVNHHHLDPHLLSSHFLPSLPLLLSSSLHFFPSPSSSSSSQAVHFLHECGVLLHYDDLQSKLSELYFLDPEWLCTLMAHIITVQEMNPFISPEGVSGKGSVRG